MNAEAEKLNILRDHTPLGKINFVRCLIEARKAVTKRTIKHGWKITGNWPLSRSTALKHPEIQVDKPEETAKDPTIPQLIDIDDPVMDRGFIMSLVDPEDRAARYKARFAADRFEEIEARLSFLEQQVEQFEAKEATAKTTNKRKTVPVASYGQRFYTAT